MRRLKLILLVTTIMATLLAMNAGPALADDDGCIGPRGDNGNCIGVETDSGHHDWDDDWDDDWDCDFVGWDDDEAIYVCEVDFD